MTNTQNFSRLPYNPLSSSRELKRHYISATESEIDSMLKELKLGSLEELYAHVPANLRMTGEVNIPKELGYNELLSHMEELASKNHVRTAFLGDGLPVYKTAEVVPHILNIRNLTTSYTPYQPERSQGTLTTLWIYQCTISALTGFEAVNASFYDRATSLFEALKCAQRLIDGTDTVLLAGSLYPADLETIRTMATDTDLKIEVAPINHRTGLVDLAATEKLAHKIGKKLAALVFPQVNHLGLLEDVDALTNLAEDLGTKSIAVIDPALLASGGLKAPVAFGRKGTHMFVAEGQHLAIPPNFGGPGLGIFGIRFNAENKNDIRQTAGRFIGKSKDLAGRHCFAIILSTREQHIRREKATSNICSNQAYIATVAGAALLEKGDEGLSYAAQTGRKSALFALEKLTQIKGVEIAFADTAFYNEFVLKVPSDVNALIAKGCTANLHIGVDVTKRVGRPGNYLMLSFTDVQSQADIEKLIAFFEKEFGKDSRPATQVPLIPRHLLRDGHPKLPSFPASKIKEYYSRLGEQNVSPDDHIYALGSCTMKYNPYINDYAAALPGFENLHPAVPEQDAQGALEILYATQEYFKAITGLAGVTTQPMAGAQGEFVGLKMFQAYHRHRGDSGRDIMLIPRSAHGTNPATATMAGFDASNIKLIEADTTGQMNMEQVRALVKEFGQRIAGVMVTNPNTSGILETNFKEMADLVHTAGGLVYMDGANMNAIAGWLDLGKMGVDAVHNNTHKTWSIPHGGGGPGDAIVAVSEKLVDFLPGVQAVKEGSQYKLVKPKYSIGVVHRHFGNFGHKVRCYTYLRALGRDGVKRMSAMAVLSARYLHKNLSPLYPTLPAGAEGTPRMHEFILTLSKDTFARVEASGTQKNNLIPRVGKLFLDFGLHAPTVAFPEVLGLMVEPTESYTKAELDSFTDIVKTIHKIVHETPEVLQTVPHFTPIDRVDEVFANKALVVSEPVNLPNILPNRVSARELTKLTPDQTWKKILEAHRQKVSTN